MKNFSHVKTSLILSVGLFLLISCSSTKIPSIDPETMVNKPIKGHASGKFVGKSKHTSAAWHRASMRDYTVKGRRYYPRTVYVGEVMNGVSSWYGPHFHGKRTSNGEIYNMHARTAAHKTWPMDTMVRVRNLQNGKSTVVRINDRGPYVTGRIIDCSYKAGKELGLDRMGIAKVSIEVLGMSGGTFSAKEPVLATKKKVVVKKKVAKKSAANSRKFNPHVGLQLASFSDERNAKRVQKKYLKGYHAMLRPAISEEGKTVYRVVLRNFVSQDAARWFKKKYKLNNAILVRI